MANNTPVANQLKAIDAATTPKELIAALNAARLSVGKKLAALLKKEETRKITAIVLYALALASIVTVGVYAYIGALYVSNTAQLITVIFTAIDLVIATALYFNWAKGFWLRALLVVFEIGSMLIVAGYISGYVSRGNISPVTGQRLATVYNIEKEYFTSANTTAGLLKEAAKNARVIADQEKLLDHGQGPVYTTALQVGQLEPARISPLLKLPVTPTFGSLSEANDWLQKQKGMVKDSISSYTTAQQRMIGTATGYYNAVDGTLHGPGSDKLNVIQNTNLNNLEQALKPVTTQALPTTLLNVEAITPDELKGEGMLPYVGYFADILVFIFVVLLATNKTDGFDQAAFDKIKEDQIKNSIQEVLTSWGIEFGEDEVPNDVTIQRLIEVIANIEKGDYDEDGNLKTKTLKKYLAAKMTYGAFVVFSKKQPLIAKQLNDTGWSKADIENALAKDPDFLNYAEAAFSVSAKDWRFLTAVSGANATLLVGLDSEILAKLLVALRGMQGNMSDADFKAYISKFIATDGITKDYITTLQTCYEMLPEPDRKKALTPAFVRNATPATAEFVCTHAVNLTQFKSFMMRWNKELDETLVLLLDSDLAGFPLFLQKVFNVGGLNGFTQTILSYQKKKEELENRTSGNPVLKLEYKVTDMEVEAKKGDAELGILIDGAFKIVA